MSQATKQGAEQEALEARPKDYSNLLYTYFQHLKRSSQTIDSRTTVQYFQNLLSSYQS